MNRRSFLSLIPAVAIVPVLGKVAAQVPSISLVQRKRLGSDERRVTFSAVGGGFLKGPFQLRSKGNGLWIDSVTWEDEFGKQHHSGIAKNLPLGHAMPLPMIGTARSIAFAVTCLPLASKTTIVELAG